MAKRGRLLGRCRGMPCAGSSFRVFRVTVDFLVRLRATTLLRRGSAITSISGDRGGNCHRDCRVAVTRAHTGRDWKERTKQIEGGRRATSSCNVTTVGPMAGVKTCLVIFMVCRRPTVAAPYSLRCSISAGCLSATPIKIMRGTGRPSTSTTTFALIRGGPIGRVSRAISWISFVLLVFRQLSANRGFAIGLLQLQAITSFARLLCGK